MTVRIVHLTQVFIPNFSLGICDLPLETNFQLLACHKLPTEVIVM